MARDETEEDVPQCRTYIKVNVLRLQMRTAPTAAQLQTAQQGLPTSNVATHAPLAASQMRTDLSQLPLANKRPSGLQATETMLSLWPCHVNNNMCGEALQ